LNADWPAPKVGNEVMIPSKKVGFPSFPFPLANQRKAKKKPKSVKPFYHAFVSLFLDSIKDIQKEKYTDI